MVNKELERWLKIPGHKNYSCSNMGRVRNDKTGRIIKGSTSGDGYVVIVFHIKPKSVGVSRSRLVGKLFVPNPDNLPEINHLDLDKKNDAASNLEWTDRFGNIRHAFANRKIRRGYESIRYKNSPNNL